MNGTLYLPLKYEYFDQIKAGTKKVEYRLYNDYWQKRLVDRCHVWIILTRGYPKKTDEASRLKKRWKGFKIQTITHKNFGDKPVKVFAIDVS